MRKLLSVLGPRLITLGVLVASLGVRVATAQPTGSPWGC
jgi:hypothetical protein